MRALRIQLVYIVEAEPVEEHPAELFRRALSELA